MSAPPVNTPSVSTPPVSTTPVNTLPVRPFLEHPSPWILGGWAVVAIGARIALGAWGWVDLIIPLVMLAVQPVAEWVIHVTVLHFRARTIRSGPLAGRVLDLHLAIEHRKHHEDPKALPLVFVPIRSLVEIVIGVSALAALLAPSLHVAATIVAMVAVQVTVYEWIHYLIHTTYRPRGSMYRSLWRSHRLHHYRNEHYWLGVTSNLGDRLLRTFPEKGDVPLSPTATALGG